MDAQYAAGTPEWRSTPSHKSITTSSPQRPHLSPHSGSGSFMSVTGSTKTSTTVDGAMPPQARDLAPWEAVTCIRLIERIHLVSSKESRLNGMHLERRGTESLHDVLQESAVTIRYHAAWFSEDGLAELLSSALDAVASSSSSAELNAMVNLLDVVGIYHTLPLSVLENCIRFISQTYYNATRANKTKSLAQSTWQILENILVSHLGLQTTQILLDIIANTDEELTNTKVGYSQVAGALQVLVDKILLKSADEPPIPRPSVLSLLDSLNGPFTTGGPILIEQSIGVALAVLQDSNYRDEIQENGVWDELISAIEPLVLVREGVLVRPLVSELLSFWDLLEGRQQKRLTRVAISCDAALDPKNSAMLVASWSDPTLSAMTADEVGRLLATLARHTSKMYLSELQLFVHKIMHLLSNSEDLLLSEQLIEQIGTLLSSSATSKEAGKVLVDGVVDIFLEEVRLRERPLLQQRLLDLLCTVAPNWVEATGLLLRFRSDACHNIYIDTSTHAADQIMQHESRANETVALRFELWERSLLKIAEGSCLWAVYRYFSLNAASLLANHTMFENRMVFIKTLASIICDQLTDETYPSPPPRVGLTKSHVAEQLVPILTAILGYREGLSKPEVLALLATIVKVTGSRDYIVSIPCIHALTIFCYELPGYMSNYMDDVIDKMAKLVTQRYLAIHVLQFLAGLSRLPDLYRNFQTHDFKKIFGVCGSYLQSLRGSSVLNDRQQSQSSDHDSKASTDTSDALPHYVFALAHHVIAFWYLSIKPERRGELKEYIVSRLRHSLPDGKETFEDQGLVTVDLMDRIDSEETRSSTEAEFFAVDGRRVIRQSLTGVFLITTETALRTAKSLVTVRRPSGTTTYWISRASRVDVKPTTDTSPLDYLNLVDGDKDGKAYGKIFVPRAESPLGSADVIGLSHDDEIFQRALQSFDRTPALDSHKAGLLYVGEGQKSEEEILLNAQGSPDYVHFYEALGDIRRLKGATFNTQGLDRHGDVDGQHTFVWQGRVTELVLHITTLMPTTADKASTITNKKRHVGNDFVNIVFNNSGAPFDLNTFASAFMAVYIVITPSARTTFNQTRLIDREIDSRSKEPGDRFYKVQLLTRQGYPSISSAADEKVISSGSLPAYVRNLTLNECVFSSILYSQGEYPSSWRSRLEQLRRLKARFG